MEITLHTVTFDCADAGKLARFWSQLLARPVDEGASAEIASIGISAQTPPRLVFVQVPEAKQVKNRIHLDLVAADLAAAVERALELGAARLADHAEGGYRWTTLADPEGNEFDLVAA
ncbi:VOC family protein [[Mycobacterium] holstebronense]|uniref:VOC family protein n=1 Tax=[Mycobacterium] holstebronense TaxID=3064288 RepID=A0ABM9LJH0_9MYCO|nr:VOC family protein [Mycolicibacter sp. MU0102]CAJ1500059.1 VOC family protein [Mycolicibacter sp. MU0102]